MQEVSTNIVLRRLREDREFAGRLAAYLRDIVSGAWGPDTAHPDYAASYIPGDPAGQCYVTSLVAAHCLRTELGLDAKIALGSLWSARGRKLEIAYHGWVLVGNPMQDPIVLDLTPDQACDLPPFLAGRASEIEKAGFVYQYQETAGLEEFVELPDPSDQKRLRESVKGRWLALDMRIRADRSTRMKEFRSMAGLDLSQVTDVDVAIELGHALKATDDPTGSLILSACELLASQYSFADTRTYPRPDHPDPRRRRSLAFLITGILVSLRTTLENEQRAMDAVLGACPLDSDLYEIEESQLAALIRPAGMPEKRAKTVKKALSYCRDHFGDDFSILIDMPEPEQVDAVGSIPGFGPKSRDCFLSIGMGVPSNNFFH